MYECEIGGGIVGSSGIPPVAQLPDLVVGVAEQLHRAYRRII